MKKEIKIGIFVVGTLAILGWGLNYLKGRDIFFRGNIYYGIFTKVDGLTDASPIYYHGFKIGAVRNIDIDQTMGDRFIVTFATNKNLKLPKNSVAQIYSLDLLGSKGIQFIQGNSLENLQPNDTLSTSVMTDVLDQLGTNVLPLKEKTERLISRFDTVLAQASVLFDKENVGNINAALASLATSMRNFEQVTNGLAQYTGPDGEFRRTTRNLDSLLSTLNRQGRHIDTTMKSLASLTSGMRNAGLDQTILALKGTLQQADSMLTGINQANGSLGMLLNDDALYNSLAEASANLNRLLLDVRYNPKRYVSFSAVSFGKKVYVDASAANKDILFAILLFDSENPVTPQHNEITEKYKVAELYDNKKYNYFTGQTHDYAQVLVTLNTIKSVYPKAEVIAIENEKIISVKQALKKINK